MPCGKLLLIAKTLYRIKKNKIENHMRLFLLLFTFVFTCNISIAQEPTADYDYIPNYVFNESIVKNDTSDIGEVFQKIVIDGYDSRFPFYLIQPQKNPENRFVILLHGAGGTKDSWRRASGSLTTKYVRLKDSLLSLGFAVIIPEYKYYGERSYEIDFAQPGALWSKKDYRKFQSLFTTTIRDIRIIMDYIESKSEKTAFVFHAIGYSRGGKMAILLNSADHRLKSVVACVPYFKGRRDIRKRFQMNPELENNLLSIHDLFRYSRLQKAPISILVGNADKNYTLQEVNEFYDQLSLEGNFLKIYDAGHILPDSFIADAIKFIE
jgi:dienelactone hydrolase